MDRVVVIDKPKNMTSRDVVNIVGKKFNTKKVGHAGTLDPIATGVLVVGVGKYTKLLEVFTSTYKTYEFECVLGIKTDTYDITGVKEKENDTFYKEEFIKKQVEKFPKTYEQEVPIYSAVKINGKKLYEYARNNEKVTLPKRKVEIKEFQIKEVYQKENKTYIKAVTTVSKGCYIRSLIVDFANTFNEVATMTQLRRIKQGMFDIKDSVTLDHIEKSNLDIKNLLSYPIYELNEIEYEKVCHGNFLPLNYDKVTLIYQKEVVAIYQKKEENLIKPYKMLVK